MREKRQRCRRTTRPTGALVLLAVTFAAGCAPSGAPPQGADLAERYCASCHAFPDPDLLSRASWPAVLADMGGRLGIYTTVPRDSLIARFDWQDVDPATVYPPEPVLTQAAWDTLSAYYLRAAPDGLASAPRVPPLTVGLPHFEVRTTPSQFRRPLTTLTQIHAREGVFLVGNYAPQSSLVMIDRAGRLLYHWKLAGAPVAARWDGPRLLILLVGQGPRPTDASAGAVLAVDGPQAPIRPLITGLKRPVDLQLGDLNGDGRQDLVVCEYGHHAGALSWYEAAGDGTYRRHGLTDQPGAVKVALHDFDGDGRLDLGVLMAQGDEGFDVYRNQGGGRFDRRRVLRFPPVYGSNHFALADFNGDGLADILYANGDNGDLTPAPKPYHGVRIFLADEAGGFQERFFFPLHGAVSAKAADFDYDGDLDVAAIAFFPDYARAPEESFVLLENAGDLTFSPFTFPDAQRGRWLTMDVGDLDGDADPDILLGSNIGFGPQGDRTGLYERWVTASPSVLILENTHAAP